MRIRVFILAFTLLAPTSLSADDPVFGVIYNRQAESVFQRALAGYINHNYAEARLAFREVIDRFPTNQRTSASRLMLAKTHYKLKEYSPAIAAAVELYEFFPYSRYLSEADLVIGDCYFHQKQVYGASAQYARILTGKSSVHLKARAADRLGQMAGTGTLSGRDIQRLKADFGRSTIEEAVAFGKARWPLNLGRREEGFKKLSLFLERHPNGLLAPVVRRTLLPSTRRKVAQPKKSETKTPEMLQEPIHARYKVGVIAPLESSSGKALRDGILLAREQYPLSSGEQVGLVFGDSKGDPIEAFKEAKRIIDQHDVIAIVGALTSMETTTLAGIVSTLEVPLIAPTASDDGIASLSPYVFQINATPGAQGRRLADYGVRKLGLQYLATLASRDPYGTRIVKEFTARAEELGAEVVVQEWYAPGTKDYQGQFRRMRNAGLALQMPKTFADEVNELLLGDIQLNPPPPVPVDPDTVELEPVETIDGLLVAGGQDDILLIAPQVAFHRINAQLLGSDEWNHEEVARDGGSYVDGTVFVAKYYDKSDLSSVRDFVDSFRTRFGRDQTIAAALGYDAMLAVLSAMEEGGTTRERLRGHLETLSGVSGATGRIAFSRGNRENAGMYILTIRRRKIVPLSDDLQDEP